MVLENIWEGFGLRPFAETFDIVDFVYPPFLKF